jgi:transketolase
VILIATGSEVEIALEAAAELGEEGVATRVVALPSWELFEAQEAEYREAVLPHRVTARVVLEAGSPFGWERYAGNRGAIIGLDHFGASAPGGVLYREFGITADHVVKRALELAR